MRIAPLLVASDQRTGAIRSTCPKAHAPPENGNDSRKSRSGSDFWQFSYFLAPSRPLAHGVQRVWVARTCKTSRPGRQRLERFCRKRPACACCDAAFVKEHPMNPATEAGRCFRKSWSLTQIDVLFCAMPIVFFLSIVSFV